jgi:hypothetical protein
MASGELGQLNLFSDDSVEFSAMTSIEQNRNAATEESEAMCLRAGAAVWARHLALLHLFGLVPKRLKNEVGVELGSASWAKMQEILHDYDFPRDPDSSVFKTLHLCESPGSFVSAVHHWCSGRGLKLDWKAVSLAKASDNPEDPWNLSNSPLSYGHEDRWILGASGKGDLTDPSLIRSVWKALENKANFITADGDLSFTSNDFDREDQLAPLKLCEVVCALGCLASGGSFVIRLVSILHHSTISLLWILRSCFSSVELCKPLCTRDFSSEIYAICKGYQRVPEKFPEALIDIVSRIHDSPDPSSLIISKLLIPRAQMTTQFLDEISCASMYFSEIEIHGLKKAIQLWNELDPPQIKKLEEQRDDIAGKFLKAFETSSISSDLSLVVQRPQEEAQPEASSVNVEEPEISIHDATVSWCLTMLETDLTSLFRCYDGSHVGKEDLKQITPEQFAVTWNPEGILLDFCS